MNNKKILYIPSLLLLSLLTACPSPTISMPEPSASSGSYSLPDQQSNGGYSSIAPSASSGSSNNNSNKTLVNRPLQGVTIPEGVQASRPPVSASTTPTETTGTTGDIKERATFNGTIYDSKGNVVNGAIVTATSIDPAVTWSGEDQLTANGAYVFRNAPVGTRILITVTVDGFTKTQTQVLRSNLTGNPDANKFDFDGAKAIDARPLFGRVYDINDNLITSDVEVIAESTDSSNPWIDKATVTQGTYRFENIPVGVKNLKITVKAKGKEVSREYTYNDSLAYNYLHFGGTNANDKAFAIQKFRIKDLATGINLFKDVIAEPNSTFAVDVDTASYTLMRNSINNANSLPSQDSVRIEEYVNYFDYNYPKPEKGFSINTEITNSPFTKDANKKLLRIGLQGREIKIENRKDAIITLVIDTSGSMTEKNKLETIKSSIKIFLKQLAPKDRISIIAYSNEAKILIDNADISQENQILDALSKLQSSGGTNIEAGLTKGSEIAQKNYVSGAINRVLLCSDGANTMGESNAKAILDRIKKQSEVSGINFSSIGVGFENYNDQFLEQVATNGDGYYAYIDSIKEAVKVFVENATNTLQVIAKDAKVQVKFNPKSVKYYRLLGYENKILNSNDFRNDKVDAGEIGPNHSVTALYEIETISGGESKLADVIMRYKDVDLNETVLEINKQVLTNQIETDFNKASYSFRLASTVALYAEILRGSYWSLENNLDNVSNQITSLQSIKSDEKVSELKTLVDKAKALNK
jgi:Ca-activated chloride channel family protein